MTLHKTNLVKSAFVFDPKGSGKKEEPTEFAISLLLDGQLFEYEVHYNEEKILFERFSKVIKTAKKDFFVRVFDLYDATSSF